MRTDNHDFCKSATCLFFSELIPRWTSLEPGRLLCHSGRHERNGSSLPPGADPAGSPLLLLHGTGGTERDLLAAARDLAPAASTLAVRGSVEIEGGFAFFRRHPDRTVDEADIAERASALAAFVTSCREHHGFAGPVAVGFSNGAIMAAALLLTRPGLLRGAILFRPLLPLSRDLPARIQATPVLIIDGRNDTRRSHGDGLRLAQRLTRAGAAMTHHVLDTGHAITSEDIAIAREWLVGTVPEALGQRVVE